MNNLPKKERASQTNPEEKTKGKIEILTDFTIINISEGGILTETRVYFPENSIHFLKLPYEKKELLIKGIIKRVEQEKKDDEEIFKIAFQFIELTPKQKELLKDFISSVEE